MKDYTVLLKELKQLRDWEGKAITDEAVDTASNLTPVPLYTGGLQLELHAGGADITIEIGPDGKVQSVCWCRA